MTAQPICSFPALMDRNGAQPRWAKRVLTWSVSKRAGILVGMVAQRAWKNWMKVCDIRPHYIEAFQTADVAIGFIELRANTLASSDMPPPNNEKTRMLVHLNAAMQWAWIDGLPGLDPERVLTHELGHVLGLTHGPAGSLMHHEYNASITTPQAWDVREAVERYGRAKC
jgi:hypothetical protein